MAESSLKVNSLRLCFPSNSQEPMESEIFDFMRGKMRLKADNLLSMYKDRMDASVVIKFKTEEEFKATLSRLPTTMEFTYNKYQSAQVRLSPASAIVKYVRLFNLPPEVDDREIGAVLAKYGRVQRLVREKYGEETGFPIWTSVRGAYVELKEGTEIPATLYVRNLRTRIYYEGLANKCFLCGETNHIKVNCPKRKSDSTQGTSYSNVVAGGSSKWTSQATVITPEESQLSAIEAEKRPSSPSIPQNEKDAKKAKLKETHDTSSGTTDASTIEEQQQKEQSKDGATWKVPGKRGRKPKSKTTDLSSVSSPELAPAVPAGGTGRALRPQSLLAQQSLRNRSRSNCKRNEQGKLQNAGVSPPDDLEGTFLAETFASSAV